MTSRPPTPPQGEPVTAPPPGATHGNCIARGEGGPTPDLCDRWGITPTEAHRIGVVFVAAEVRREIRRHRHLTIT